MTDASFYAVYKKFRSSQKNRKATHKRYQKKRSAKTDIQTTGQTHTASGCAHAHSHAPATFAHPFAVGITLNLAYVVAGGRFGGLWCWGFVASEQRGMKKTV